MQKKMVRLCKRGEVYESLNPLFINGKKVKADLLIIQNDVGNKFSPTTIVIPIIKNKDKIQIVFNNINTVDKQQLGKRKGKFSKSQMEYVDERLGDTIIKDDKLKLEQTIAYYEYVIELAKNESGSEAFINEMYKILAPIKQKYLRLTNSDY